MEGSDLSSKAEASSFSYIFPLSSFCKRMASIMGAPPLLRSLLLGLCIVLLAFNFSSATEQTERTVAVVGNGDCLDCAQKSIKNEEAFKGLHVAIQCKKTGNGFHETKGVGSLDESGSFDVQLPSDVLRDDGELKDECFAQLRSDDSEAPCPDNSGVDQSKIVLKSKESGKHTFVVAAGKLPFSSTCTSAFHSKPIHKLHAFYKHFDPLHKFKHKFDFHHDHPLHKFKHKFDFHHDHHPLKHYFPPKKPLLLHKPPIPVYKPVPIVKKPVPPVPIYKKPDPPVPELTLLDHPHPKLKIPTIHKKPLLHPIPKLHPHPEFHPIYKKLHPPIPKIPLLKHPHPKFPPMDEKPLPLIPKLPFHYPKPKLQIPPKLKFFKKKFPIFPPVKKDPIP